MTNATLIFKGHEYVLVPRKTYERLTQKQQDRSDGIAAQKAVSRYRAGKLKTVSHVELKRKLGL